MDFQHFPYCVYLVKHVNIAKSESLTLVEKIDLVGKKSPKVENFIFCLFNFHITQKKLLGTLRAPLSRTRDLVFFFGRKIIHWLCSRSAGRVMYL